MHITIPWGEATGSGAPRSAEVLGRFSVEGRYRVPWIAVLAVLAVAAQAAVVAPLVTGDEASVPAHRIVFRLIGGAFTVCGLIAWRRRPDSRSGPLMVATGFGLLVEPLFAGIDPSPLRTVGDLLEDVWAIPIIALLLTFLTGGRLETRLDRALVGVFVLATALEVARHFFLVRDGNFLLVHAAPDTADALLSLSSLLVSLGCVAVAGVIGARWAAASRPRRRAMLPSVAGISSLLLFAVVQHASPLLLQWLAVLSLLTIPGAFLAGLLRSRLARGGLAQLFGELPSLHGVALQDRLARTLGDPGLVLAYRVPGRQAYAAANGEPVSLPRPGGERSAAPVERDGREIAALVYDAALDDDPELIEAVRAATTVALENAHLHAESQVRMEELRASRQRLVAAADGERKRLERDLHDGAQQRLVALSMQLRLIQADIRRDPQAAEQLVDSASSELALSLAELRELARGLHPAALEYGLPSALESLAARATVPTAVECDVPDRVPQAVELAVYFVACEALANIGKYARATTASIRVSHTAAGLAVEVADDGVGGAVATAGGGLHGLADRVEALDGHLLVTSPPHAGTVVSAELPCAS